jgi:hypothetical protein
LSLDYLFSLFKGTLFLLITEKVDARIYLWGYNTKISQTFYGWILSIRWLSENLIKTDKSKIVGKSYENRILSLNILSSFENWWIKSWNRNI